jgi:ankyrin repeat protein
MDNEQLFNSIQAGNLDQIQSLLNDGADINFIGEMGVTPLFYACKNSNIKIIKFLLNNGASIDLQIKDSGFTPLHFAAQEGQFDILKLLVESGANVNAKDDWGNGPLWRAGNKIEIGKYLISKGADPKMENNSGISPYNSEAVAYEYIKNPSQKEAGGQTTDLIEAIINKDMTSIALMTVSGDLKLEETDGDGKTALFIAAETGYEQVILLLIKQGANVNAKANDGTSIFDATDKAGFSNISKTLKANGAE